MCEGLSIPKKHPEETKGLASSGTKRGHCGQVRVSQGESRGSCHQTLQNLHDQGAETRRPLESGGALQGLGQGSDKM